jgi:hypothetical protein
VCETDKGIFTPDSELVLKDLNDIAAKMAALFLRRPAAKKSITGNIPERKLSADGKSFALGV